MPRHRLGGAAARPGERGPDRGGRPQPAPVRPRRGADRGRPGREVSRRSPPRRLPKALSLDQVQAHAGGAGRRHRLGLRDAALLELLYGTGARISEAVGLDVDEVARLLRWRVVRRRRIRSPTPGLRLLGKGSKERIVPLGSYARAALDAYLVRARPGLARARARARRRCSSTPGAAGCPGRAPGRSCGPSPSAPASPPTCRRTRCGTASPPICWTAAPTSGWCRSCSATPR